MMIQRWSILLLVSIVMMMGYVFWDIFSPLSTTMKSPESQGGLGWTATEYGLFAGSYSFFNVFLLMLFWGGILLDRMGVRFTGIVATGLMATGAIVCYYAMTAINTQTMIHLPLLGQIKWQVAVSTLGFGMFGVGCDITGITISKIITKWFNGYELASAMGVQVALARVGTALAISMSPLIAMHYGFTAPIVLATALLLFGMLLFILYATMLDKRFTPRVQRQNKSTTSQEIVESKTTLTRKQQLLPFFLIVLLCVTFYSSIRPFLKFATDVLINKFGMNNITAGWITSLLPYGTIILTPLFGNLYDRVGRGATLMLIGTLITLGCHLVLMLPGCQQMTVAVGVMFMLGVAFSLVPSAMWASIPQIVPYKRLGVAYAIIFYIQNLGLMFVPVIIGASIDRHTVIDDNGVQMVNYTEPMGLFALIALLAVVVATLLLMVDRCYDIGLEKPNIK